MRSKYLLPSALLAMTACLMPLAPARASLVVLDDSVGFIKGTQIFTDSFDITTPGTLTVTLTAVPWLDTLQDLNCFLTTPGGGLMGATFVAGTSETVKVVPGEISVNWYGTAAGTFKVGAYAMNVSLQAVPVPASLPLLLSGLLGLSVWRRKSRSPQPPC
jgi:hypothetical protein